MERPYEVMKQALSFSIIPLTGTLATTTNITIEGLEPFWNDKSGLNTNEHEAARIYALAVSGVENT